MKKSEADYQAELRYKAKAIKQIGLCLNRNTDADIIEWLASRENVQGYIKELIRTDIGGAKK